MTEEYDYIIVGAGSAGCILANRLSAERDVTVCLLEAGPPDRNPFIHIPDGFIKTLVDSRINWMFSTEPSAHTGGRSIPVPRVRLWAAPAPLMVIFTIVANLMTSTPGPS